MSVTKRTDLVIMTADGDEVSYTGAPPYIKYVALETVNVEEAANFDIRDESGGVNMIPLYAAAADGSTPPAEFAIEGTPTSETKSIYAENIPTGGRVFIYLGRR